MFSCDYRNKGKERRERAVQTDVKCTFKQHKGDEFDLTFVPWRFPRNGQCRSVRMDDFFLRELLFEAAKSTILWPWVNQWVSFRTYLNLVTVASVPDHYKKFMRRSPIASPDPKTRSTSVRKIFRMFEKVQGCQNHDLGSYKFEGKQRLRMVREQGLSVTSVERTVRSYAPRNLQH